MNRARRESLNCLNADKEQLEHFARQEQSRPSPELSSIEHLPGSGGVFGRNRSKSLAYGLTWAQAMNGRAVNPTDMFGILNADESSWQGPWVGPGSSIQRQQSQVSDEEVQDDYLVNNRLPGNYGGGGGSNLNGPTMVMMPTMFPPPIGIAPDVGTPKLGAQTWEATLERSIRSIVSITANHVRSFDTETSGKQTTQRHTLSIRKTKFAFSCMMGPTSMFFLLSCAHDPTPPHTSNTATNTKTIDKKKSKIVACDCLISFLWRNDTNQSTLSCRSSSLPLFDKARTRLRVSWSMPSVGSSCQTDT